MADTIEYRHAAVVTPNDGADLSPPCLALYVGGAGNITLVPAGEADGTNILISAIPAGTIIPLATKRVRATATTATLIVALW